MYVMNIDLKTTLAQNGHIVLLTWKQGFTKEKFNNLFYSKKHVILSPEKTWNYLHK